MGVEADATPPPQSAPPRRPSDGRRGRPPTSSRGPRGIGVGCVPSCSARVEPSDTVGVSENQERDAKRSRRGPPAPATAARPKAIPPPPFVPPACPPPQMTESAALCLRLPWPAAHAGQCPHSHSRRPLGACFLALAFGCLAVGANILGGAAFRGHALSVRVRVAGGGEGEASKGRAGQGGLCGPRHRQSPGQT